MLLTNFASGELSPTLNGRTDLQQYYSGAGRLENFDVIPTGGIRRRPGTKRLGSLHDGARLIPFIINSDTSFILEIAVNEEGNGSYIYFWKDGSMYLDTAGAQVKVEAPWTTESEIKEIQYAQTAGEMYFVQRKHAPFVLSYSSTAITSGSMSFDFTPDIDLDDDYGVVYVLAGNQPKPTTNIFDGTEYQWMAWKGKLWDWNSETSTWDQDKTATEYELDQDLFTGEGKCPGAVAIYNGRLYLGSTDLQPQKVWASASPDISGNRYNQFNTYNKYVTVNKVVTDPDLHFFTASGTKGSDTLTGVTQDLSSIENITDYYVTADAVPVGTKIQSFTWDSTTSTGTIVLTSVLIDDATRIVMSCQKWIYRTTASEGDYYYKIVNNNMTSQDNGFYFELASDENDGIKWITSAKYLVIGTESGCYVGANLTALNTAVSLDGRYGADSLQATSVNTAVIFFGQGKRKIREYYYSSDSEAFESRDLAMTVPEMLSESPAVDWDYMNNPDARILVTRADGSVVSLLYEKSAGVQAWSRMSFEGKVRNIAVTPGSEGADLAYLAVETDEGLYLDLWDPNGSVYLDGYTVSGETVTGTAYRSLITSMPLLASDPTGKKRITSLLVRFYNSYKPVLRISERDEDEVLTDFEEPYTGIHEVIYPGDTDRDVTFTLYTEDDKPVTVLAVNAAVTA